MTHREAYIFGWVYGLIEKAIREKQGDKRNIPGRQFAAERPLTSTAQIFAVAATDGVLTHQLDLKIGKAFEEITWVDDERPEPIQPLEVQGSWQLGYYRGISGEPLPPPADEFRIEEKRRAKGYSQARLAEAVGVTQTQISRWELGKDTIPQERLEKLKEILN